MRSAILNSIFLSWFQKQQTDPKKSDVCNQPRQKEPDLKSPIRNKLSNDQGTENDVRRASQLIRKKFPLLLLHSAAC